MIEVGRHNNTPKELRYCPFCPNVVENEKHFMFICPSYTHLRKRYLEPVCNSIPSFQYLPHDAKLQALLSSLEKGTCKFIASSMDLRKFLTSKPKNTDCICKTFSNNGNFNGNNDSYFNFLLWKINKHWRN